MLVHVEIPGMSLNLQDPLLRLTGIHPRQTCGPLLARFLLSRFNNQECVQELKRKRESLNYSVDYQNSSQHFKEARPLVMGEWNVGLLS